jgi:hypothetical protein
MAVMALLHQSQAPQSHALAAVLVLVLLLMARLALVVEVQQLLLELLIQEVVVAADCLLLAAAALAVRVWLSSQFQHPNTLARQLVRPPLQPAVPTQF